jgi:hypothetical protein
MAWSLSSQSITKLACNRAGAEEAAQIAR